MATTFPTTLQDLDATRGTTGQALSSPNHITHHQTEDDTIEALQAKVGVDSSAVTTSLDYKITNAASIDPGHKHTATTGGTGNYTFTKGDILVASNSTTLTKLAVGANNSLLVADSAQATGVKWGGSVHTEQVFTSSGTWTKPTGCSYVLVELCGGGGAGGGSSSLQNAGTQGGGAGGYSRKVIDVSAISTVTVTIGAGGTGVSAGTGNAGGTTSFGAHCSATGGAGGVSTTTNGGGGGGTGSSGDVNITGGDGFGGFSTMSGNGGGSFFGGGPKGVYTSGSSTPGNNASAYGAGGSAAAVATGQSNAAGGNGAGGIVIVKEFYA
jgi:hypothetical protein